MHMDERPFTYTHIRTRKVLGVFQATDIRKAEHLAAKALGYENADQDNARWDLASYVVSAPRPPARTYTMHADGIDHEVTSIYPEGDFHLVVDIVHGRAFRVGTDETPTIDSAVAAARAECARLKENGREPQYRIIEEITHEAHMAAIERANSTFPPMSDPWYLTKDER